MQSKENEDNGQISFKEINENDTIGKAISLFGTSTDILIVRDRSNRYSGVLVEWAILRSNIDVDSTKVKHFAFNAPKISKDTPVSESARLMVENNLLYLPVFEDDRLTGVLGYKDILSSATFKDLGKKPIKGMIPHNTTALSPDDKLSRAFNRFKVNRLFSMPVVENNAFLGTVCLHDVVKTLVQHHSTRERNDYRGGTKTHNMDVKVVKIMSHPQTLVHEDGRISEVVKKMTEHNLDSIRVVDNSNKLSGVITLKELLKQCAGPKTASANPNIRISSDVADIDRAALEAAVKDFLNRYGERLAEARVEIKMHELQEHRHKQNVIFTHIIVHSHKDSFESSAEEYGELHSLRSALGKLETRIESTKQENKPRQRMRRSKADERPESALLE